MKRTALPTALCAICVFFLLVLLSVLSYTIGKRAAGLEQGLAVGYTYNNTVLERFYENAKHEVYRYIANSYDIIERGPCTVTSDWSNANVLIVRPPVYEPPVFIVRNGIDIPEPTDGGIMLIDQDAHITIQNNTFLEDQ
jgi:hypothetical protein